MKMAKIFFCALLMCVFGSIQIQAQQKTAPTAKKIYDNIQVEKFTIKSGVEFDESNLEPLATKLVTAFQKTKRFNQVNFVGAKTSVTSENDNCDNCDNTRRANVKAFGRNNSLQKRKSGRTLSFRTFRRSSVRNSTRRNGQIR